MPDETSPAATPVPRTRELTDPTVMRAMAHPMRLELLVQLGLDGPLTASECAERLGTTPAACSFHLRQLAKYGFVEEAPGGKGRARPWRRTSRGHSWAAGPAAVPGLRAASETLSTVIRDYNLSRLEDYLVRADEFGPEWSAAAIHSDWSSFLTPDELAEVATVVRDLLEPYLERLERPETRPEGARAVSLLMYGFPLTDPRPPAPASDVAGGGRDA